MATSPMKYAIATPIVTGLLVFGIMATKRLWHPTADHLPYWLVGLIGGGSSLLARCLVKTVIGSRT